MKETPGGRLAGLAIEPPEASPPTGRRDYFFPEEDPLVMQELVASGEGGGDATLGFLRCSTPYSWDDRPPDQDGQI